MDPSNTTPMSGGGQQHPPRITPSSAMASILSRPTPLKSQTRPETKEKEDFEDNIHASNFDEIKNMPTGNYHKFPNLSKIEPKTGHLADLSKN